MWRVATRKATSTPSDSFFEGSKSGLQLSTNGQVDQGTPGAVSPVSWPLGRPNQTMYSSTGLGGALCASASSVPASTTTADIAPLGPWEGRFSSSPAGARPVVASMGPIPATGTIFTHLVGPSIAHAVLKGRKKV